MTSLTHTCENCSKQLSVPDRYLGRSLKCPHCATAFMVETPAPELPPAPAPPPPVPHTPDEAPYGGPATPALAPTAAPGGMPLPAPDSAFVAEASVRFRLKHIDVISAAKVSAAMHGLFGFALGLVIAFSVLFFSMPLTTRPLFTLGKGAVALLSVVVVPGSFAVTGLVMGAMFAFLYNLNVKLFGTVEIELE